MAGFHIVVTPVLRPNLIGREAANYMARLASRQTFLTKLNNAAF